MTGVPASNRLPQPTRERWQPLRLGLVELYHYDAEEFWFHDGHLLLRGNNGTGKSKVLSLTLPFLLDANMSASRVEPDGDRSKRMEWNLLMDKRYERRIGYTWIEFGRRTADGEIRTLTLGCGLRAVAGRPSVDPWFFITDQRIGADLWLTTPERTALSRDRLSAAIGTNGQVFETAQAYRRAVDERLFRLGPDRYAALVDTLIQLRQPQLSKNPNEQRLSDALTEALPPLDRVALEDVAEAMSELDDIRRGLEERDVMRKAVAAFGSRYRRYAQIATRRRARLLRQAQTDFDNASRELNAAAHELEEARTAVAYYQDEAAQSEEQVTADDARLEVLRADPVMREAARIEDARKLAEKCRTNVAEADARLRAADGAVEREEAKLKVRQTFTDDSCARLSRLQEVTQRIATETGIATNHTEALRDCDLPDGVRELTADALVTLNQNLRAGGVHRREQIGVIRKRLGELAAAEQACATARAARAVHADAFDAATEAARQAAKALRDAAIELLAEWRRYGSTLQALHIPDFDERLEALELWVESRSGPNPLRGAVEQARHSLEQRAAAREAELREARGKLAREQSELFAERQSLETGVDRLPSVPYTRDAETRAQRDGAPLWKLVDFANHVPEPARAGLEAALESSGILDAWVSPEGVLLDPLTHDVILVPRPQCASSLAQWLIPTIPTAGTSATIQEPRVRALLESIACTETDPENVEAWVSPTGQFRVGGLRGAWSKPQPAYIGHAAREMARQTRLAEIATRLAEIGVSLAGCDETLSAIERNRRLAESEYQAAPADDRVLTAAADHSAAERQRREAQERLGEADARLSQAQTVRDQAVDTLSLDARDLQLPAAPSELDDLEWKLTDYRIETDAFVQEISRHQNALAELEEALERAAAAREALEAASADHRSKSLELRAADERVQTLRTAVGAQVDQLLQQIEFAEGERKTHVRAFKDAQAKLVLASGNRSAAEQKCRGLGEKLAERGESRKQAIEELRSFAAHTGFVAMAVPELELPDAASSWGVEGAITVARRAEQALTDVQADDTHWERIQRDISHALTDLQSAMSAQGHSATFEPSEHGLIVRIVYQQRAERPDTLERQLIAELEEQRLILSAQERAVLENHLEKEIAANLQRMMSETETRVRAINAELDKRPTSTGVRYRLDWQVLPEDSEYAVPGLAEARRRLLKKSPDAWSPEERRQVGEFLQARINAERQRDDQGTLVESLSRALDYRRWHRFAIERKQYGEWRPLSGPASSGERALGLTVPLFAAASSHYESADTYAPRLVLLDEAFAGIDDEARASCMGLIREFDLDFVMTSEREWGCYPELPGLRICQLVRREGMDAVLVSRWRWDGRARVQESDEVRRFPELETTDT